MTCLIFLKKEMNNVNLKKKKIKTDAFNKLEEEKRRQKKCELSEKNKVLFNYWIRNLGW